MKNRLRRGFRLQENRDTAPDEALTRGFTSLCPPAPGQPQGLGEACRPNVALLRPLSDFDHCTVVM